MLATYDSHIVSCSLSSQIEEEAASLRVEVKQKDMLLQQAKTRSEEQLRKQTEQLTQAEQRHGSAESRIAEMQAEVDSLQQELIVVRESGRGRGREDRREGVEGGRDGWGN